jgi:hypothetical protein
LLAEACHSHYSKKKRPTAEILRAQINNRHGAEYGGLGMPQLNAFGATLVINHVSRELPLSTRCSGLPHRRATAASGHFATSTLPHPDDRKRATTGHYNVVVHAPSTGTPY